jgi:PAS domain S-box-containing protein
MASNSPDGVNPDSSYHASPEDDGRAFMQENGKKAEGQPAFDTAQLQAILNVLPAYAWYTAPSGGLTFVNKRAADFLGLPKDHPLRFGIDIGAPWDAHIPLLHPDDQEDSRKAWSTCLRTGRAAEFSQRVRNPQGEYRWFLSRAEPLRASDGTLLHWVGVNLDVEELKCTEQALRESEYQLRQIIETVPALLWSSAPDGELTDVNQRILEDYFGVRFEDLLHRGWADLLHPDDLKETANAFTHAIQTGTSYRAVHRLRRADGEYRWHESRSEPLRDRQGNIIQWYGLTVDIDEAKKAEDLLRRSEAHLVEAQRLSHTGAVTYNGTAILFASEETYRIWGFDPAQGLPSRETVFQRIHPDDRGWLNAEVRRAVGEKRKYSIGYRILLPDGTVKHLETIGQPVFSASGELVEIFAMQTDVTERKRAEQALRESEYNLTEAQRLSHTGSWAWSPDQDIRYWSEECYRVLSFDPQGGLPRFEEFFQRIHPDDQPNFRQLIETAIREKAEWEAGYRIVHLDGAVRDIHVVGHPVLSTSGHLVEFLGTVIDVTERKRAEQALRESEGKFRDYAETASDWFWEFGPDYKFTLLTENAFGSDSADRIGAACWEHALDLETEPEKWRVIQETLNARRPFRDFVYRGLSGDGSPMYVRASGKPVFDANGEFRGYRGTGTDVTAVMRVQEALRESERSARSALDGIAGLVAIMTPNGEVETVNRQCLEYFGRSLEDLKSWQITDTVHPEDLPQMLVNFKRAIASEIPYRFEQRLRRFDGAYRWFDTRGGAVRDSTGRIVRWYVLLTDIEDRVRALARLEQMQSDFAHMNRVSMMGELAASLSHEITQPIASARNNARAAQNFLNMQPPDLGEVREALSCVVGDTDRAGDMIDRIRDQIKKAPPRKAHIDLNEAINEVVALGRSAAIANGISVQTRLSAGLAPIHCDRVQLQQVVLNLLLNAVEAMGWSEAGERELLISTEQNHTGALVAVRDSGPGIDPSHLERVFDTFYTTKSSGMGMGLSICRSIIDAHGGRLWAEANEPRGAIFKFSLPAVQAGG